MAIPIAEMRKQRFRERKSASQGLPPRQRQNQDSSPHSSALKHSALSCTMKFKVRNRACFPLTGFAGEIRMWLLPWSW